MSAAPAIRLEDVTLSLDGRTVLDRLCLEVVSGSVTAVIGPNGAGKSVTLRVIDGLLRPDGGTVRVGPHRRAFVFQRPALIRATAAANVALALGSLPRPARAARVQEALARVRLAERARDAATRFSGGEQQRLALARAWAVGPDLLLLDEPTANLDPASTEIVEGLVSAMARAGTTVVLVSHNLGQVARLADTAIVLASGRAVEHGPSRQILFSPRTSEARAYLAGELPWTPSVVAS
ncbi:MULTISPECIES: ATP-binding cassette domain-containing protein [Methylobacterium]|jgi:tungstate transport system ATP-binding protein|uniref:ABC transporter related n=1 Tax=Methylobacterium radiotolerans (strain ATCC 27329 / DSM 1819 / JCM 2831 / NBRC 15690 / NCIMB 10815 / 0-1) TaxID=426355 RepID=B1M9B5_METRJ|nr:MULTISPECIES: ATP-binding cassette domain-containing protein [Methylobacterium]GAN48656.1 putative ABC transporter [Methylobacterium sp. ME121]ACB28090.1 ABC transporter related [Methylobacterium radiotolerans JCM 2831]KTS08514.1 ABC transporter ATP-binding protein [Methylobacterium radiotolerans]KTS45218.1 ABC transporter ATP-binding protein [Methylobacterium radiotolerans]MBN6819744.1 ATP-binding cassette domain-containing protein [Methylobacterium organophilum]